MSELARLELALHLTPGDDSLWLAASDCLEEEGQTERAALVRLIRRARGMKLDADRAAVEAEAQKLLRADVRPLVPTLVNSIGMRLALLPAGEFWIGSPEDEEGRYDDESPRKRVPVPRPFYLGAYAVTQAEYFAVTKKRPSAFKAGGRQKARVEGMDTSGFPVERVSWADASAFCAALSALPEELAARRVYRLPTEAEWEYGCRGEVSQMSPHPLGPELSTKLVNYRAGSTRSKGYLGRPVPCGSLPPNGLGLFETVGNTWEWCGDWYEENLYSRTPAAILAGAAEGDRRNARGGTYALEERRARSADRSSFDADHRDHDMGFRVLMEWTGPDEAPKRKGGRGARRAG
ncbi:MAG: formylglycine-generating enzyme family protein [Gemmataceae bacterium]|nr:formylglycine-generating enzyme family protein [Gemmataceae bacterium]